MFIACKGLYLKRSYYFQPEYALSPIESGVLAAFLAICAILGAFLGWRRRQALASCCREFRG